ncbi:MAG: hypothetical protein QG670_2873 [Thermoproteota archaeon]|nr:hypothetical protein [Thermoproteota archaeon]
MKCNVCKKELLLVEIAIARYVERTVILGVYGDEVDLSDETDLDETLDREVTHYECSHCGDRYNMNEDEMVEWLKENPEYQDWGEREEE